MALQLPRSQGPTVDPTIAPTVRVRPSMGLENFGGGRGVDQAAGAARGLAGDVSDIAFREEMRAQEAQANDIDVELGKLELKSREGLYAVQGGGALAAQQKMLEDYDKASGEILKKATSARVRERVGAAAERRRIALEGTTKGYVRGQMLQFEEEKAFSRVKIEGDNAVQAYNDPLRIALALDEQASTIKRFGAMSGKPKEWVDLRTRDEASKIHRGIINQHLSTGNDLAAKAYFEAHQGELADQAAVREQVDRWSALGEAQRTTDELSRLPSLARAREALKSKNLSPEIRERADSMLVREFGLKDKAAEEFHDKEMSGAINDIVKHFKTGRSPELLVGPQRWDSLSGADRLKLEGLVADLEKPEGIKTKAQAFTKLHGMTQQQLSAYTEEKFISEFLTDLDPAAYNHARKLWKDSQESAQAFKSTKNESEMVLDAMRGAKLGGIGETDTLESIGRTSRGKLVDANGETKSAAYKKVWDAVEMKRQAYYAKEKKNPDDLKYKEFASEAAMKLAREVTVKERMLGMDSMWRDRVVKLSDLTPDELKSSEIDLPRPLLEKFHNLAITEKGFLPKGTDIQKFRSQYNERINLAYLASINGEEDWGNILKILKGE